MLLVCPAPPAAAQTLTAIAPAGTSEDIETPRLTEEQAKAIARSEPGIAGILAQHPELEPHVAYDSVRQVWTVYWTLPGNAHHLAMVEVFDRDGSILNSRIESEAYLDIIPSLSEQEVIDLARAQPLVSDELGGRDVEPNASFGTDMIWTVGFYEGPDEVAQVLIDDDTGLTNEVMIGPQVAWQMARGYQGAFGRIINEPYVWLPLCLLFLLPFVDIRRPFRMLHLDLLVLLSFTVSHYYFNRGEIFTSVPLAYPPLVYLFLRMGWIWLRRWRLRESAGSIEATRLNFPPRIIFMALVALIVFRLVINVADSNVVDVGYSGVIGADRILNGETPYGNMPSDDSNGDTYGPFNYVLYIPFEKVLPWSGKWDDLPAAHAAAIFFDLATVAGMFFCGRALIRGRRRQGNLLGLALAYAWVAYPYTTFVQNCNVNDTIVAAFIAWGFVFLRRTPLAGLFLGLATQIKFFPAILGPLWASFPRAFKGWGRRFLFVAAFAAAVAITLPVVFLGGGSFGTFWERSIEWQIGRDSPFSIWGQHPDKLAGVQHLGQYALAALAFLAYLLPPRKTMIQTAAASAALIVGFQLLQTHWFYLYIPWFIPMVLVAILPGREEGRMMRREIAPVARGSALPL